MQELGHVEKPRPIRIVHVITGLARGGAETMLAKLLARLDADRFRCEVISLTDVGSLGAEIERLGVPVRALGMKRGTAAPRQVFRLMRWLRDASPDVVHTWMYHADLLGGVAAKLAGLPVIWCVRQSQLDRNKSKKSTILTAKACAALSSILPVRIVCCSTVAARVHDDLGYASEKLVVIPNGFDLERFKPDAAARSETRRVLDISPETKVAGMVARFDPQKDHAMFIEAARILRKRSRETMFVLCGPGVTWDNEVLVAHIAAAGLTDSFRLLGERADIERVLPALDVCCLSSAFGEGFPNVLGEAMACEVPCVATDIGDSAYIIETTGVTVPPSDAEAFATGLEQILNLPAEELRGLGAAARARIVDLFALDNITRRFDALYEEVARSRAA